MNLDTIKDEVLMSYLLGDLPDAERQALEERFFRDDSFFEEILAFEDELFYKYRQNQLTPSQRTSFEQKFLKSREDRNKMDFAGAFLQATAELAGERATAESETVAQAQTVSWWQSVVAFFNFNTSAMQYGLAAAVLLLMFGAAWLFVQNRQLSGEIASLEKRRAEEKAEILSETQKQNQLLKEKERQQAELAQQLTGEREQREQNEKRIQEIESKRAELAREIAEARQRLNRSSPIPGSQPSKNPLSERSVIAVVLSPGMLNRGGGEGLSRVKISPSVKNLQIRLSLKNEEEYKSYRTILRALDAGTDVWTSSKLKAQGKGVKKSVSLNIPAKILQRADYEISLVGVKENGETEELAAYYFSVLK